MKGWPSTYQALWGKSGDQANTSMHMHNWWLQDDSAHTDLEKLVTIWQRWGVDAGVQAQLVSLINVFNGKDVLSALSKCKCREELPIQYGQLIPEMWSTMEAFLDKVLGNDCNPFSCRFRGYAYSACLDPWSEKAKNMVRQREREVVTHLEAKSLEYHKTYEGKLTMLSRTKGYSDAVESSFLGKNLVNTLSALAESHAQFAGHHVPDKSDHPNGPGATAFFARAKVVSSTY